MGLWLKSPSWMKSNSHSPKEPKTSFHVYFTFEREKRSCCHVSWYHSLAIDLSLFPSCAIYGIKEAPEMNYHTESPWLCCHSPNSSAGIEVLRPETLWTQPGSWEGNRNYPRWPSSGTILGTSLRIQAFSLTGSVSSLEHKYSSPESRPVYECYSWCTEKNNYQRENFFLCRLTFQNVFKIPLENIYC